MTPGESLKPPKHTDGHGSEADTRNSERGSVSRSGLVTEAGLENCGAGRWCGAAAGRRPALRFDRSIAASRPSVCICVHP